MLVTRVYKNAAGDTLRTDEVFVQILQPGPALFPTIYNNPSLLMNVGPRKVTTSLSYKTGGSRVVSSITVSGDYDSVETSSTSFVWASKTLGNGQLIEIDMSDLPLIGESV